MELLTQTQPADKPEFSLEERRRFMLAATRSARARLYALVLEFDEIGVALDCRMISPEGAASWIDFIGAMQFVAVPPWSNKIEVVA